MKKSIVIVLITIIMFNVLFTNFSFAFEITENTIQQIENAGGGIKKEDFENFLNNGKVEGGSNQTINKGTSTNIKVAEPSNRTAALKDDQTSYFESAIAVILGVVPILGSQFLTWLITDKFEFSLENKFTIESLLKNKYSAFDINFFSNNSSDTSTLGKAMNSVQSSVAKWYYVMRTVAIIAALCVLLYIAIRMITSTLGEDQAKYKKMLKNWLVSFIMLFVLHYAILILINIEEALVSLFVTVSKETEVETMIMKSTWFADDYCPGSLKTVLILCVFLIMQMSFAWKYLKRKFKVAFLIMVSPLITITYAIDKADDGQAQAFAKWFKMFLSELMIQPLQLIMFLIFSYIGLEIAKSSIIVALIFLILVFNAEKIFKIVLNWGSWGEDKND